ncbi:unnamed protein product [Lactuca virosa]|uniref:Uncharacterized protein n=1 Tax=Lactuca virosa TaxID=75947 RepID=A0AAU9MUU7_9ASTR|nr:unnamed protein product [Lactuca virosa]
MVAPEAAVESSGSSDAAASGVSVYGIRLRPTFAAARSLHFTTAAQAYIRCSTLTNDLTFSHLVANFLENSTY